MGAFSQKLFSLAQTQAANIVGHRPPWKAKSVWAAFAMMLLGSGLWISDSVKQKDAPAQTTSGLARSAESSSDAEAKQLTGKKGPKPGSPALFRFGASYIAGFFVGWAFRRFLKAACLLSAAAIALIALGKKLGWFDADWASAEEHVRNSRAWVHGEAGALKTFLTSYLPSAGAAGVGAFLGFRRK